MSYILDALRRADAERSRGAVPGLHAQSAPAETETAARRNRPLMLAAGAAGALAVAVVALLVVAPWRDARAPATPANTAALVPAQAPTPAPAPAPVTPAAPALAQGELPAAQPGAIEPAARLVEPPIGRGNPLPDTNDTRAAQAYPPKPAPQPAPAPRLAPDERFAAQAAAGRVATLAPAATARTPAAAPVEHYGAPLATPAAAGGNATPKLDDLPPNVRSQLPRLASGGSIYSETPSARMVILNGQVFHEGDKPAADTVIELIRPKSAVLNYRGQRYEISL